MTKGSIIGVVSTESLVDSMNCGTDNKTVQAVCWREAKMRGGMGGSHPKKK